MYDSVVAGLQMQDHSVGARLFERGRFIGHERF
jgi:hypothetical protein